MAGYRFWLQSSLSIVVALIFVQVGRSQTHLPPGVLIGALGMALKPGAAHNPTCKVYSLAELGDDPKLCKWVAETIPEMIQPASWKHADAKLSYYAPSKILVVNNTPAVHAQVDEFLLSLRKSLPQKAAIKHDAQVVPAQFALQDPSRPLGPVPTGPGSYPVPVPPVGPKHLFHFIIRYEGEGIIDSNVAKFAEALNRVSPGAASNSASYVFPPPPATPMDAQLQRTNGTNAPTSNAPPMPPADAPPAPPNGSPPTSLLPPPPAPAPPPASVRF